MAIHCNVCYQWKPHDWQIWRFVDKEAFCMQYNCMKGHDDTCEHGSIVPPQGVKNDQFRQNTFSKSTTKKQHIPDNSNSGDRIATRDAALQPLYAHQHTAIERYKDASVIPMFAEVGCGKSRIVLAIAEHKFKTGQINALLVIAPNGLHVQMAKEEIPKWLHIPYDLQCFGGRGGAKQTYPFEDNPEVLQIVCVNIDTFSTPTKWQDIVEWANYKKTFIILDEGTVIKNYTSQRTQRILYEFNEVIRRRKTIISSKVRSVARTILTGTPVTNSPLDLWTIMEYLQPNFWGRNWYSFKAHYGMYTRLNVNGRVIDVPLNEETWAGIKACTEYNEAYAVFGCSIDTFNVIHSQDSYQGPYKNADELKARLDEVAFFCKLTDCVDMPPQEYNIRTLYMSTEQQKCYDSMVADFVTSYNNHTATALNKMTAMIRLQQISSGFICDKSIEIEAADPDNPAVDIVAEMYGFVDSVDVLPNEIEWIGKTNPKLEALYRDVDEAVKPIIIATRFTAEAARIYDDLSKKYSCCLMTGWKRVGTMEDFKAGKYNIMVANSAVMARGFNLQNSHVILIYSNTFSLETRLQLEGRIFRIGQTYPCEYIDYSYEDSIDEKIIQSLRMKRNLLDFIKGANMREVVQ